MVENVLVEGAQDGYVHNRLIGQGRSQGRVAILLRSTKQCVTAALRLIATKPYGHIVYRLLLHRHRPRSLFRSGTERILHRLRAGWPHMDFLHRIISANNCNKGKTVRLPARVKDRNMNVHTKQAHVREAIIMTFSNVTKLLRNAVTPKTGQDAENDISAGWLWTWRNNGFLWM